jgi:hypothetical protein
MIDTSTVLARFLFGLFVGFVCELATGFAVGTVRTDVNDNVMPTRNAIFFNQQTNDRPHCRHQGWQAKHEAIGNSPILFSFFSLNFHCCLHSVIESE